MSLVSATIIAWQFTLVGGYWLLPRRLQMFWVIGLTGVFLYCYSAPSLVILIIVSVVCYYGGQKRPVIAAFVCMGLLIFYRAFSSTSPILLVEFRQADDSALQGLMVLGFSYYILRAIHYLVEQVKGWF